MLNVLIWGTGRIATRILQKKCLPKNINVIGFIDNSEVKQGNFFNGKKIYSPDILMSKNLYDEVIILIKEYDIVEKQALSLGVDEGSITNYREIEKDYYKKQLMARYKDTDNDEIEDILKYLENNQLQIFNYQFAENYYGISLEVSYDSEIGMFYTIYKGKTMYFAKSLSSSEKVLNYYRSILVEQDERSPHRYFDDEYDICDGAVVVDVGVAEGNFALEVIDKVSHIYLVESDPEWVEALSYTFMPYKDKVTVINTFVNSFDDSDNSRLDSIIDRKINFLKMDIEGFECDGLIGAERMIKESEDFKCAICAYHSEFDESLIINILEKYGVVCKPSRGYMWFPGYRSNYTSNKLVRGLVRGKKCEKNHYTYNDKE